MKTAGDSHCILIDWKLPTDRTAQISNLAVTAKRDEKCEICELHQSPKFSPWNDARILNYAKQDIFNALPFSFHEKVIFTNSHKSSIFNPRSLA